MKTPKLVKLDLSKCCKVEGSGGFHGHPDINHRKQYLIKLKGAFGGWYAGSFNRQWYGWNFDNWGMSGLQLDKPGTNGSEWVAIYEIREKP